MGPLLQLAGDVAILAADPQKPKGPEFGKSGPLGLAVIVALLAVTFLLIRSMNKHVKNLPESFDDEAPGEGDEAGGTEHGAIEHDVSLTKGDGAPSGGADGAGGDTPR
ncbi:hypothetical protein TPB0596_35940 [Tsukamurella pulmonis]|uniref:Uncharacterized protein n=1 Tax=Tsukamurella pulmonis TaxID=47312 RepID=A0A1H1CR25_9ACTN|nr:hypothetical protein [Tsukamurella pulmonis]BDD83831.1 hypothetical protein TPB0596_35940 [Tsukamurella pulmonis]SDQ66469.1 hypothetical protein SAMN04489765_1325 [Tsukamurella pulmonis]SUP23311.1 Uncharacterised protein [Tsukamurella pulmonis]